MRTGFVICFDTLQHCSSWYTFVYCKNGALIHISFMPLVHHILLAKVRCKCFCDGKIHSWLETFFRVLYDFLCTGKMFWKITFLRRSLARTLRVLLRCLKLKGCFKRWRFRCSVRRRLFVDYYVLLNNGLFQLQWQCPGSTYDDFTFTLRDNWQVFEVVSSNWRMESLFISVVISLLVVTARLLRWIFPLQLP